MEYEVLWGDGPLGLTLRPDLGEDMPPVVGRITRLDSAAALAKVAVGHMLVSINGMDTARQGYDHVVEMLQKIPRPATLRFRVPRAYTPMLGANGAMMKPSFREPRDIRKINSRGSTASEPSHQPVSRSKREQYTVVWTEGPLGMILRPDDEDCHVPCIRKITGKGAGTGMERASVGDILVAVNGQETKSLGFRSTISLLKTIRKPAVLKFKRMSRRLSKKRSSQESPSMGVVAGANGVPKEYGVYDIVWREGDLGLKLKPGHRDVPVLSKLTGKGTASGLQNANVGDELVSVNGHLVEGSAYQDTLRMLKHSPKPAVLRFRPGKDRRESMMSTTSIRSTPATSREVERVQSRHVPIYDTGRPVEPKPEKKKKKRIPLDVARELVAASQGIELEHATFAGMRIMDIEEGTDEAHLLRVKAKLCITNQADKNRNGVAAKEALTRAEQEAKVLQEALEKVKNQAKKYEEILEAQSRNRVLANAFRHKPEEVIDRQNNVIAELSGVIAGFKRDSYSEIDTIPAVLDDEENRQQIMSDLNAVMSIPVVVPASKYCAECGATESESKLDMDDDGQYYCKDCWDKFLSTPAANTLPADVVEELTAALPTPEPVTESVEAPPFSPPAPLEPSRSLSRMKAEDKELEEKNARLEAEKKLLELKELRRSGSMRTMERQSSSLNSADRTTRDRRGMEELAQALLEEEERARAEGNIGLAKKLSAQRARTMADSSLSTPSPAPMASSEASTGVSPLSTMGDLDAGLTNGKYSSAEDLPPPPPVLMRGVSADSHLAPVTATSSTATSSHNDYSDVNSDEEADDHVDMSDTEEDVLREVEEKNFALARQLDEAHSVIERARMSIMMSGDEAAEETDELGGLSEEQISLFKKLTSQADERASMVDRLHPQDDSDSDSDGSEDEEEEEDDGVWI